MQDIGREYVRYINSKYQRSGTLWEGRFRTSLVDSEAYCLVCYRYIELNPVRAGMVATPDEYNWSSYSANGLGVPDELLSPHPTWLSLGKNAKDRRKAYRELFEYALSESELEAIRYGNRKGLPLGSEEFRARIESQLQVKLGTGRVGRPARKG